MVAAGAIIIITIITIVVVIVSGPIELITCDRVRLVRLIALLSGSSSGSGSGSAFGVDDWQRGRHKLVRGSDGLAKVDRMSGAAKWRRVRAVERLVHHWPAHWLARADCGRRVVLVERVGAQQRAHSADLVRQSGQGRRRNHHVAGRRQVVVHGRVVLMLMLLVLVLLVVLVVLVLMLMQLVVLLVHVLLELVVLMVLMLAVGSNCGCSRAQANLVLLLLLMVH